MKKNLFMTGAIVFMMVTSLFAQNVTRCSTMEYLAAQKIADPALETRMNEIERQTQQWIAANQNQRTAAVITVPVVVHVLYSSSAQNISDARIIEQINVLNKDYGRTNADAGNTPSVWQGVAANTQIQFCLAQRDPNGNATNGIVRKSTTTSSFSSNDNVKHNSTGGDDAWPAGSYLNIWVCNLGGGLLGYATFPGGSASVDGVVVLYTSVGGPAAPGTETSYNLGRTATHEVGHWLNLRHINGDSNCGSDLVSDTPTQDQLHFGCFTHPYHVNVCSGSSQGEMFMNYMDYTDDNCMNMFTAGQAARMTAALTGTRSSIQSSLGCTPGSGGTCNVPAGLNATSITSTTATLNWSAATGAVSYNVHYRIVGATSWISTTSTTTSKAISGLTASSQYEFQVQNVCSSTSSAYSSSANFSTSAATCTDNYEPNNTKSTTKTIPVNSSISGLISPSGDYDFYTVTTVAPNTYIKITLSNLPLDYNLKLFNSAGTLLKTSANIGTTNEVIIRNVTTTDAYNIRVYGAGTANSASQCYSLTTQTSSTPFRMASASELTDNERADILTIYPNPVKDVLSMQFNSSQEGKVTITIIDMVGRNVLATQKMSVKGVNSYDLNMSELSRGIYFVEVNNGAEREIRKIILNK